MSKLKVHGTDLSHHNPTPDFKKAKAAGLQWCIHKATEGSTVTDKTYGERRQLAAEAGILWGAYAFARPDADGKDAKLEVQHLMKVARPKAGDIVPALDFEVSHPGAEAWCKEWMAELGRLLKLKGLAMPKRALHYGPNDFGADYPHYRWVPRYNNQNTPPNVPWDIFQFSNGQLGNPNNFPGLGNVDLNHMKDGFSMQPLLLRPLTTPQRETEDLFNIHVSMQFSDTRDQQTQDAEKIFARAEKKGALFVTGTEAGEDQLWGIIRAAAERHGYKTHRNRSNWVAVQKSSIGSDWETGDVLVADSDDTEGRGHDPAFPWVSFEHSNSRIGKISIAAGHYPRFGQQPTDPNHWVNKLYAEKLGAWAKERGAGKAIVFYNGDQNMPDQRMDTFFDQPLTSLGDELQKWPNTGHGPIDVMASYDADVRVVGKEYRVFNDQQFFLNTDHFYLEGIYEVGLLKA